MSNPSKIITAQTRPYNLKHTTNSEWAGTQIEENPQNSEAYQVCQWLFGNARGFVKVGLYGKHLSYPTEVMCDSEKMAAVIGSRRFKRGNAVMSVATYRTTNDGTQKNILSITALCIDVDYTTSSDSSIKSLDAITAVRRFYAEILMDEIIPMPTYIEVGRNFKLIYVLEKPFVFPNGTAKREAAKNYLRRIIQVISETIQKNDDWGVDDKYKIAPYIRIPESNNVRWDFRIDRTHPISIHEVRIWPLMEYHHIWDFNRLADTVLPELPDWYNEYKRKQSQKRKKGSCSKYKSATALATSRLKDLEKLQSLGWDIGTRELMNYYYRLFAVQAGMSEVEALNAAQYFNSQFIHPLSEHEVQTECRPSSYFHKHKNSSIRCRLGLGEKDYPTLFVGDGLTRHDRYIRNKNELISSGKLVPKQDKMKQSYSEVLCLFKSGKTQKQISESMNLSLSTIKRYFKEMKSLGMLVP